MDINKGFVSFVGAGPGDLGLVTQKCIDSIKKADVILYDRLANPRLLR
ncbi:SAM-dependent methyltransferase, partial [Pseudomonas sp. 2995-3]